MTESFTLDRKGGSRTPRAAPAPGAGGAGSPQAEPVSLAAFLERSGKSTDAPALFPAPLRGIDRGGVKATTAEWRLLADLTPLAEQWRALAGHALEQNVFYDPSFALAAAPVFGRDAGAVLVWSGETLIGFFPARAAGWRGGFMLPLTLGWTHPYAPLGTPLVARDRAPEAIAAWLDFLAHGGVLPRLAMLPLLPAAGPFARTLAQVLRRRGGSCETFARHERALLSPGCDRAVYLDAAVSAKKRKELARQRRRLAGQGEVATVIAAAPDAVAGALDEFFAIEQRGWKGRGGTAAAQDARVQTFLRDAVISLSGRGQAQVVRLQAGTRAVAAGILLRSGAAGWFWKIAYDEDASRASPGVQLALDLTRAALDDPSLAQVDSCATSNHPMIDHVWRERLALADFLIAPDAASSTRFRAACVAEHARRSAVDAARKLRSRLR